MTTHPTTTDGPVPAGVEPDTVIDLVDDCREVSGVLGLPAVVVLPEPRPASRVEISARVAASLDGYGPYGT